jgi:thiol-disulfide isomerase/thioredoxin
MGPSCGAVDIAKFVILPKLRSPPAQCAVQNLAPIYEQLADAYTHAKDKVVIAKVDADGEGRPLGSKYGVTGFPSMHI